MYNFVAIFGLLLVTQIYGSTETDVTHVDESAISGFGSDSDYDYNYLYEDVDQMFTNKTIISPNGEFEFLGCISPIISGWDQIENTFWDYPNFTQSLICELIPNTLSKFWKFSMSIIIF